MGQITPQPGIMGIALYQSGASKADGVAEPLKLSANENPFGPSPAAKAAATAALDGMHRYPGTDHASLRAAIAEVHGLEAEQIICGVGSDEILSLLAYAYAGPGDEVVHTEHGFAIYDIVARAAGAVPVVAPERDRVTDVDAILAACTDKTRLVFIANPNNPTATMIGGNEVARLADGLPPKALLVLDGAYAEFAAGYDGGAALVAQRGNVVMTRTFSKLYGLGGLRIGWGYAPREIIDVLNRLRGPFNLSAMQMAAAEAAVRDQGYAEKCLAENARLRVVLAEGLAAQGISCDTSLANFVLARFADEAEAQACNTHLLAEGIIVRPVASYGLPHCLRMTVGTEDQCARLLAAVAGFRAAQR